MFENTFNERGWKRNGAGAILGGLLLLCLVAALGCSGDDNALAVDDEEVECTSRTDCDEGLVCRSNGVCDRCLNDASCAEQYGEYHQYCTYGQCSECKEGVLAADGWPTTVGCDGNQECRMGRCYNRPEPECQGDGDCDDGLFCSHETCVGCRASSDCDDDNGCTFDYCEGGACQATPTCSCLADADCADRGLVCDEPTFTCVECTAATDCGDDDDCTADYCDQFACRHTRVCGCRTAANCHDGDDCTLDSCDGGECVFANVLCECAAATEAADCDDGDECTAEYCDAGHACGHTYVCECDSDDDCADTDPCTFESCNLGACVYESGRCECEVAEDCEDDGNRCTFEYCEAGACEHAPMDCACERRTDCDDGLACTLDYCNENLCTFADVLCECADATEAEDCDDGDECTHDYCNARRECEHFELETDECDDDGTPSTGELCTAPGAIVLGSFTFEERIAPFEKEDGGDATADLVRTDATAHNGSRSLRIDCTADSTPQFHECMAKVVTNAFNPGRSYLISFWAKANAARDDVRVQVIRDTAPYTPAGLTATPVLLTTTWTRFEIPFTGLAVDEPHRVSINTGFRSGQVWIDDFAVTCR